MYPRFRLEAGLLFATKYGMLTMVLPINGKRAAFHCICGG